MANMGDATVDAVVCDPPYHLSSIVKRFGPDGSAPAQVGATGAYARASRGFMGKTWDGGDIAFDPSLWAEVLRVLKPGGHLIAFSGTRTYHRMACAIEDAGFEIRDMLEWLYGSGFPKGGLDDAGRGPALKPAHEPMCLARKSFKGSAASCVAAHGTGLLNIDDCRIAVLDDAYARNHSGDRGHGGTRGTDQEGATNIRAGGGSASNGGRFPANICHDGSPEVLAGFPETTTGAVKAGTIDNGKAAGTYGEFGGRVMPAREVDSGSAARFFYCAKASKRDRDEGCEHLTAPYDHSGPRGHSLNGDGSPRAATQDRGNTHPTVKPTDLMRWLVRLVTPVGGLVFDPFTGSGSTGKAALLEGRRFIGAEMTDEYIPIARARIEFAARLTAGSN